MKDECSITEDLAKILQPHQPDPRNSAVATGILEIHEGIQRILKDILPPVISKSSISAKEVEELAVALMVEMMHIRGYAEDAENTLHGILGRFGSLERQAREEEERQ